MALVSQIALEAYGTVKLKDNDIPKFVPDPEALLNLTILSNSSVKFPNETITSDKFYFSRGSLFSDPDFPKQPRGFLFATEDTKFWENCDQCFTSYPIENLNNEELWFTKEHDHDG